MKQSQSKNQTVASAEGADLGVHTVSTVRTVCIPRAFEALRRRLSRSGRPVIGDVADGTDGADGLAGRTFVRRTHPDDPRPRSPFAAEGNLNAERPKRRLRTTQPAGKRSRRFRPTCASSPPIIR